MIENLGKATGGYPGRDCPRNQHADTTALARDHMPALWLSIWDGASGPSKHTEMGTEDDDEMSI